jgi:hypothetical protein
VIDKGLRVYCSDVFHGRATSQDVPGQSAELVDDLCFVALRLARGAVRRDRLGEEYCNACISTPNILHGASCPALQTIKLIERLYSLREEARLAQRGASAAVDKIDTRVDCPWCGPHCAAGAAHFARVEDGAFFDAATERHIEYGGPVVDPHLGDLVETELRPEMMSHAEAAVLAAAGVPVGQRRGILARAVANGSAGVADFPSLGELWAAASPVEGCAG